MDSKNHFDFKDLISFGMFILALLTFVFRSVVNVLEHRKTTLKNFDRFRVAFSMFIL